VCSSDLVRIGIVGKYVRLPDAYMSVIEALKHAGFHHERKVDITWVDAEGVSPEIVEERLATMDGILVPGGFGVRGIEGKILAARYAREHYIPYLGLCLGLQCAVVEYARHAAGLKRANSSEFDPKTPYPVIDLMPEQKKVKEMGGTMRLGLYPCKLLKGSKAQKAYGKLEVSERHRHRYEVNNKYRKRLEEAGLVFSGLSPDNRLVEIIELKSHPFFMATQFHPEFKSRPNRPHPLFREFVGAAIQRQEASTRLRVAVKK
jgi:CTP synthase